MSYLDNLISILENIIISIPNDNALAIVYNLVNIVLQVFAVLLSGETGPLF